MEKTMSLKISNFIIIVALFGFSHISVAATDRQFRDAISDSDDVSMYESIFLAATKKLVSSGVCSLAEIQEYGGWVKSQNQKKKPVYFTYCGGMNVKNRIYLDASSGKTFR